MPETILRRFLREKEAAQLLDEFSKKLKVDAKGLIDTKKPNLEVAETQTFKIFYINGKPLIANVKGFLLPALLYEKALDSMPKITVNMGAVSHICNGADVLAPGIVKIEKGFNKDDLVVVVDERHQKPLAIALTLTDSETARNLTRGKVAKNVHYVGDALWNQLKKT